jgi:hypothetical protein
MKHLVAQLCMDITNIEFDTYCSDVKPNSIE